MGTPHPTITPQPGILDIAPYVGGAAKLPGMNRTIKLSSNENPLGPSPSAREAFLGAAETLERYPDGGHLALRQAIADTHGLPVDQITCSNGSDELISLLCQAYAGPGDEVILTEHGFEMYKICARSAGASPVEVPESDRHADVDAILAAVNERTRLVFLANPNNPTGTFVANGEITRLAENLPSHVLLVLDGAYAEYIEGFDGGAALVLARDNVVMTRTFSKIHGLGALRVGWALAPEHVTDILARVRGPFNVNAPALAAAEAAMRDVEYVEKCRGENARLRAWLASELGKIGVFTDPSQANFLLAHFETPEVAADCDAALQSRGLIVRRVGNYGLPHCLRITIGDELASRHVLTAITEFMEQ